MYWGRSVFLQNLNQILPSLLVEDVMVKGLYVLFADVEDGTKNMVHQINLVRHLHMDLL